MKKFYPQSYAKNIEAVNYHKLKAAGIRCLIFDLDNTVALIDQHQVEEKIIDLFQKLKKDFIVVIISNNIKSRVSDYAKFLDCDYISFAMKPSLRGYRQIRKKYGISYSEMCMIGDQLLTDILAGNRIGAHTILVDPMGNKDLKITGISRFIERRILNYYQKKNIMKKGEYYHGE